MPTMLTGIISLIFIAGVALFVISTAVVLFHFFYYRIEKGEHQAIVVVFVIGSLILISAELFVFSRVQWSAVNEILIHYLPQRSI